MPVFETGAFNHSATCPGASEVIGQNRLLQPDAREKFARGNTDYLVGIRRCTASMMVVEGSRLGVM
jgi:hypothetical protein